jgi:hypothetical protein
MKKIIVLHLFLVFFTTQVLACDICGCGVGSYYFGIMPQFQKNFIGFRHRYSSFDSHLGYNPIFRTQEHFNITEFWGRYYIGKKWQVLAFVPYAYNIQQTKTKTNYLQGLTDISLLANYPIFVTQNKEKKFQHNFRAGIGIKLPTGKYRYQENVIDEVANPNFQLGTGSTDFMLNVSYIVRYKKAGISSDLTYKINTKNSQNYQFGNRLSGNIAFFYLQKLNNQIAVMPNIGIYFENSGLDKRNNQKINETGGYFWANSLGMEVYFLKKFSVGFNYQNPFFQDLAFGQIKGNQRWIAQMSFLF